MFKGSTVFLMCGTACCVSCRHCMQYSEGPDIHKIGPFVKDEVLSSSCVNFFKNWAETDGEHNLVFWGGEPLIYFSAIRKAVAIFSSLGILDKLNLQLFTNGCLLNEEMVEFFNYYNFMVILSFDGPDETFLRNKIPDDSKISLWQKINNRRVNAVVSAGNPDIVTSLIYLKKKFGLNQFSIGHDFITVHWDMDKDIYSFKDEDIRRMIERVIRYENINRTMIFPWLHKIINRLSKSDDFISSYDYSYTSCENGMSVLSLDFSGNVYACHNSSIVLGRIDESLDVINQKRKEILKKYIPDSCLTCEYFNVCRVICPFAMKNSAESEYVHCSYFKKIFEIIRKLYKNLDVK